MLPIKSLEGIKMTSHEQKPKALILTGFHRSATSATANYLSNAGLCMGYDLMGANVNNLKGYFEDIPAVKLHENEFKKVGTDWQFHDEVTLKPQSDFLTNYIKKRNTEDEYWGVKDPRICLFLNDWHNTLDDNGYYFFVIRHWSSCIESLLNRQSRMLAYGLNEVTPNSTDIQFWLKPDLAAKMWLSYNKRLLSFAKAYPNITLISTQRALFEGANIIEEINHKFSFELNVNAKSPFDHSLFRDVSNKTIFEQTSYSLQQELNHVWSGLLKHASFTTKNEEANITNGKNTSIDNIEEVKRYIQKSIESAEKQTISKVDSNNVWLAELRDIDNDEDTIKFLNKTRLIDLESIKIDDCLQLVQSKFSQNKEVLLSLSRLLMRVGKYKLAIQQLTVVQNIGGYSPYTDMFLALCYQELSDFNVSEMLFKKSISAKPKKGIFHTNYAKLLSKMDKRELAEHHFNLAHQLESDNPAVLLPYCQFLDHSLQTDKAIDLLRIFLTNSFHPMVDNLLKRFESKLDNNLMIERYYAATKKKINETNLHKWLASSCILLSYHIAESDLIQRCFQHWKDLKKKTHF